MLTCLWLLERDYFTGQRSTGLLTAVWTIISSDVHKIISLGVTERGWLPWRAVHHHLLIAVCSNYSCYATSNLTCTSAVLSSHPSCLTDFILIIFAIRHSAAASAATSTCCHSVISWSHIAWSDTPPTTIITDHQHCTLSFSVVQSMTVTIVTTATRLLAQ